MKSPTSKSLPSAGTHQEATLAFIYDRCATQDTTELERRLEACAKYVAAQGWGFGGWWVDKGECALVNDHRPAFDTLVRTMQTAAAEQPRVCLVFAWDRLSRDLEVRGVMTRRVLLAGGWAETCSGEKRTDTAPQPQSGRLTSGPVTV